MSTTMPSNQTWHERVRWSLDDTEGVIRLLSEPASKVRVTGGFYAGGSSKPCFAELCHRMDKMDVLEAVLERAPNGITLTDLCTSNQLDDTGTRITHENINPPWSLAAESVNNRISPEMMRLAIRYGTDEVSLQQLLQHHPRLGGGSVHYHALNRACMATDPSAIARLFDICTQLRDVGAPVKHSSSDCNEAHIATRLIATLIWTPQAAAEAELALRALIECGMVNLSTEIPLLTATSYVPALVHAIMSTNGLGAAAIVRAGASLEPSSAGKSAPLEVARKLAAKNGGKAAESLALVTEAFMKREIQAVAAPAAGLSAPVSRRVARNV